MLKTNVSGKNKKLNITKIIVAILATIAIDIAKRTLSKFWPQHTVEIDNIGSFIIGVIAFAIGYSNKEKDGADTNS